MKKFKLALSTLAASTAALLPISVMSTSCSSPSTPTPTPSTTLDYSKSENWVYKKYNPNPLSALHRKYDVIFFIGTSVVEPTQEDGVGLNRDEQIPGGLENFYTCGAELCNKANVFVPLYSQIALNHALDTCTKHNDLIDQIRAKQPKQDLMAFMDYYFTKLNPNGVRPFILSGHSQGSASLQVVLEDYFIKGGHKAYLKNMISAYSIGYGVSKEWFNGLDKKLDGQDVIHLAKGINEEGGAANAYDTNCLISWNTEGNGDKGFNFLLCDDEYDTYCINPLNWATDATKAEKTESNGVLVEDEEESNAIIGDGYRISKDDADKLDAYIDLTRGSVICSTKTDDDYVKIPGYDPLWGGKSLHLFDGKGYFVNISQNSALRVAKFLKQ